MLALLLARTTTMPRIFISVEENGTFVTAMSAEASDMSSWLLMGLPGVAYLSGICSAAWTAIGLGIGTWLNWFFVSRRLRRYSSNIRAITVPDFFSKGIMIIKISSMPLRHLLS